MSQEALQAVLQQERLVVVDFFAPWCAACRRLFPKLLQLAENNPDVLFVKVNGGDDSLSAFVESLGVNKLPYFHFYRAGRLTAHFAANLNKVSLLRAELAAQKDCQEPSCML
jgi:thiol-disulfide isomerase/thioredoxin